MRYPSNRSSAGVASSFGFSFKGIEGGESTLDAGTDLRGNWPSSVCSTRVATMGLERILVLDAGFSENSSTPFCSRSVSEKTRESTTDKCGLSFFFIVAVLSLFGVTGNSGVFSFSENIPAVANEMRGR